MVCSTLSSDSLKCSFSSPVTNRFNGSVTVTLIRTSVVSTRMLACRLSFSFAAAPGEGLIRGSMATLGSSGKRAAADFLGFLSAANRERAASVKRRARPLTVYCFAHCFRRFTTLSPRVVSANKFSITCTFFML